MLKRVLKLSFQEVNLSGITLILVGTFVWSLVMFKSGLTYSFGMGFWGPNAHDGVWHIALAQSISKGTWEMPIFAGETIKNYHIGFDLLLAILHKLTFIPIHTLYFQILPPILAFFIGYFVYKFTLSWTKSVRCAFWSAFFVYFGGGWGWIITLLRNGEINGESLFWSQQSISTLVNPPFALSILVMFAGLWILVKALRTKNKSFFALTTLLFGILIQIKVYAGILVLAGLFAAGFWNMIRRKGIDVLKVFTGVAVLSILLFSPATGNVGKTIVFQPFWFLEQMMATPDRFYWPKMASAMANYKLAGNWLKLILAYGLAFLVFWYGNLGTRIVKEPYVFRWIKNWKVLTWIEVFSATVIITGVMIPMFFIQSGTPWNTIQFMYYSLIFSGILAGISLGDLLNKQNTTLLRSGVVIVLVLLTIPTTVGTLRHYLPSRPPAKISIAELEALNFLSQQPEGIILIQHFNKKLADEAIDNPPRALYLYESTAYVSAFTGKQTYLEDQVNLEITGYDWKGRREEIEKFFTDPEYDGKFELLEKRGITYVYVIKSLQKEYKDLRLDPEKIFENEEVAIYEI